MTNDRPTATPTYRACVLCGEPVTPNLLVNGHTWVDTRGQPHDHDDGPPPPRRTRNRHFGNVSP